MSEGPIESSVGVMQQSIPRIFRDRRKYVLAVSLAVLAVYLASLSRHWWVGRDAALYLSLSRNLVRGDGYTLGGQAHTMVPPGYPLILAGLMKIGAGSFLGMNIAMGLMGLATAAISYLLLRELVHRDWAVLLSGVFALSNELIQRSGEILSDVPLTLMLLAAIWGYMRGLRKDNPERGGWEIASLLLVMSCWVHVRGFLPAAGAAVGLVLAGWKIARRRALLNLAIVLLGCLATVGVFYYHAGINADPSASSYIGGLRHYVGALSPAERLFTPFQRFYGASRDFSRLLIIQKMPGLLCMLLLVVPVAVGMLPRIRRGDWVGPLTVTFYIGGMCAAMARVRTRYFLPVSPFLILYFIEGWVWITGRLWKNRPNRTGTIAVGLMVIVVAFNLVKVVRNIIEKRRDDYVVAQQGGKWRELPRTVEFLKAHRPQEGCIVGELAYGYLSDIPSRMIPRAMRFSSPSTTELRELLTEWDVRFAVFNTRDEQRPFQVALRKYLDRFGAPVFKYGDVLVYTVPHDQSPATQNAETSPIGRD